MTLDTCGESGVFKVVDLALSGTIAKTLRLILASPSLALPNAGCLMDSILVTNERVGARKAGDIGM